MRLLAVEKGSSMPRACADTPESRRRDKEGFAEKKVSLSPGSRKWYDHKTQPSHVGSVACHAERLKIDSSDVEPISIRLDTACRPRPASASLAS
jgi:hypothetical protein